MEINLPQLLFQIVNFSIILFVLAKFLYKPVLRILDQRAERIDAGLLAAQQNLDDKARIEEFKKTELLKAERQAQKVIDEAKQEAQRLSKEMIDKAKADADAVISKEQAAFAARMREQESRLKGRISDMIVQTSKAVMRDSLSTAHQQDILNRQIQLLSTLNIKEG